MSFSVRDPSTGIEYNGNSLNSLFAQRRNLLSISFWRMLRDILRFNREAVRDLDQARIAADTTLGAYLLQKGYGQRFIDHYIVPMGSAIWSMSLADMQRFPCSSSCVSLKITGFCRRPIDRSGGVVSGGSRSYIAPLSAGFVERIRLNCPVQRVERDACGVTVHSRAGSEHFDSVVFACHSDQALRLPKRSRLNRARDTPRALHYAENDGSAAAPTRACCPTAAWRGQAGITGLAVPPSNPPP